MGRNGPENFFSLPKDDFIALFIKKNISMKIVFIHDWLISIAGAEKVLEQMLKCYPAADIFCVVDFLSKPERDSIVGEKNVKTSFIQHLPFSKKLYRNYLPLMPLAVEQFDVSKYDLVISSSHAVAKGVLTGPDQLHICMCYSPMRYAWDLQHQYLNQVDIKFSPKSYFVRWLLHRLRIWDLRTVNGVDFFISISRYISRRIKKVYARSSEIIYPPVDINAFTLCNDKDDYYVTSSRLVPYKRVDLIVSAFTQMPNKRLKVIGNGPELKRIKKLASGFENIELLGFQERPRLIASLQKAKGYIFAAEEDFGIAPVEAMACGTPVVAYGKGGVRDTVVDGVTGVFVNEQTEQSLIEAISLFESSTFDSVLISNYAKKFSEESFRHAFKDYIEQKVHAFEQSGI